MTETPRFLEFREFPDIFASQKVGDQNGPLQFQRFAASHATKRHRGHPKEAKERKLEGLVERQSEVPFLYFMKRKKWGPKRGRWVYYC